MHRESADLSTRVWSWGEAFLPRSLAVPSPDRPCQHL